MGLIREAVQRRFASTRMAYELPSAAPWINRAGLFGERDYVRDVGDGANSSLVVPGIDFIANGFIEAPVRVQKRAGAGKLEPIDDHPMPALIRRPNRYYSGALMWMATIAEWIVDGNAYWLIDESGAGRPADLYWVPSWFIEPKSDNPRELITHYEYRPNGVNTRLEIEEVVHFRWGLDRNNPRKGCSRLKTVLREIYSDEEAARWLAALLRHMGTPGLVISPKGETTMTPKQADETKLSVVQKTTGERRGEPLVFTMPTELEMFGFSPEQMQLSALRAIPESRVPAVLGLPAAVLGFLAGMEQTKVGATMRELRELGVESGVLPKMDLFAEDLSTQLLVRYEDDPDRFKVDFYTDKMRALQEDENKIVERELNEMSKGAITVEQYRTKRGYDPELPSGETLMIPVNIMPTIVGAPVPLPLPPAPKQLPAPSSFARRATAAELVYMRRLERDGRIIEAQFVGELYRAFDGLGDAAEDAYRLGAGQFRAAPDPADGPLVDAIVSSLRLDEWRETELGPVWQRQYQRTATLTYDALRAHIALDAAVGLPDTVARQVVAAGGRQLGLIDLTAHTRAALFQALADARVEGLGPVAAARRIRQYVPAGRFTALEAQRAGSGRKYRAELIARTETKFAQNVATAAAGDAAGFDRYLAFDNRTGFGDDDCVAREGQEFSHAEMLTEMADEHPNGTLSFSPVPGSQRRT